MLCGNLVSHGLAGLHRRLREDKNEEKIQGSIARIIAKPINTALAMPAVFGQNPWARNLRFWPAVYNYTP